MTFIKHFETDWGYHPKEKPKKRKKPVVTSVSKLYKNKMKESCPIIKVEVPYGAKREKFPVMLETYYCNEYGEILWKGEKRKFDRLYEVFDGILQDETATDYQVIRSALFGNVQIVNLAEIKK